MEDIFGRLYEMTAFSNIVADPRFLIMYAIAFILLYLGIKKQYEPLLLVPIAFGVLLANFPGGDMGVIQADENGMVMVKGVMKNIWEMPLHEIAHELGLMNFIYYMLIKTGFLPPIIFMGVGALTDFGPMLRNLRLSIFGAAAQLGIFAVLLVAILMGFTPKEAASLGIIGGADGPTAIFTTIKLAPHLLGPIAIAAYSYMALVPVIIPLVVRIWCTKKELSINMKEQEKKYPSTTEIKNLRVLKILFPIAVTTIVALFVPSAVPLIGMLMFGNLVKEIGSNTSRLFDIQEDRKGGSAGKPRPISYAGFCLKKYHECCYDILRYLCWCYYDYRCFLELDDYRYCYRWIPCICLIYIRRYLVCKGSEPLY